MNVLEAILLAGGLDRSSADPENILIIRQEEGSFRGQRLDLGPIFEGRSSPLYELRPMDIVFVPKSRIAEIDQWVDQHIYQLIPSLGFYYSTGIQGSSVGVSGSAGGH